MMDSIAHRRLPRRLAIRDAELHPVSKSLFVSPDRRNTAVQAASCISSRLLILPSPRLICLKEAYLYLFISIDSYIVLASIILALHSPLIFDRAEPSLELTALHLAGPYVSELAYSSSNYYHVQNNSTGWQASGLLPPKMSINSPELPPKCFNFGKKTNGSRSDAQRLCNDRRRNK